MPKIICVSALPKTGGGAYAHIHHQSFHVSGWTPVDFLSICRKNELEWISAIENWHGQLSTAMQEILGDQWWLNQGSRLMSCHPPTFHSLVIALGIISAIETGKLREIYLIGFLKPTLDYIEELRPEYEIVGRPRLLLRTVFASLRSAFRPYLSDVLLTARILVRSVTNVVHSHRKMQPCDLMFFSYFLGVASFNSKGDHYFGKSFDGMVEEGKAAWVYYSDNMTRSFRRSLDSDVKWPADRSHIILSDYIYPVDAIKIIIRILRFVFQLSSLRRKVPPLKIGAFTSKKVTNRFFWDAIAKMPIKTLESFYAFSVLKRKLGFRTVIYPYEEKPIERALLFALRGSSVKTIGYVHSVGNGSLLYFRKPNFADGPRPSQLVCTGPIVELWLRSWGRRASENITVVGTHRHSSNLKLNDYGKPMKVLFLVGFGYELVLFAKYLENRPELFANADLTIRLYPFAWLEAQCMGLARLRALNVKFTLSEGTCPIESDIEPASLILFCSTSAGIEAILAGRLAIWLDLNDCFSQDPLQHRSLSERVLRAENPRQLEELIKVVREGGADFYSSSLAREKEFANGVFAPFKQESLAVLLNKR